jgi:magnesium-transporting ATPase (P-type)
LGVEPPERDLMQGPPRDRQRPLLDRPTLLRAYGWLGLIEATLCLVGFFFVYFHAGWRPGEPLAEFSSVYVVATTMSLAGIVACQVGNVFACRSERASVLELGLLSNRSVLVAIIVELLVLGALIHTQPLAGMFQLQPPASAHWLLVAVFGPIVLIAEELRKWIARKTN